MLASIQNVITVSFSNNVCTLQHENMASSWLINHKSTEEKLFFPLSGWKDSVRICILMRCLLLANWICFAGEQLCYWLSDLLRNFHHQEEKNKMLLFSSCIITYNALLLFRRANQKYIVELDEASAAATHISISVGTLYNTTTALYPWITIEVTSYSIDPSQEHIFNYRFFCDFLLSNKASIFVGFS